MRVEVALSHLATTRIRQVLTTMLGGINRGVSLEVWLQMEVIAQKTHVFHLL